MQSANRLVREGLAAPHRFRLLAGYVGWGPGQLNEELLEKKWWALSASAPLIISFLQGEPDHVRVVRVNLGFYGEYRFLPCVCQSWLQQSEAGAQNLD